MQLQHCVSSVRVFSFRRGLASEYDHKLDTDKMDVFWRIDGDKIHVKLAAKTSGWVAIGFDPEKAMQGANIIIGAVKKGKVRIEDHLR